MARRPFSGTFARNPQRTEPTLADNNGDINKAIDQQNTSPETAGQKSTTVSPDLNASLERLGKSVQHLREAVDYRLKLDENQGELRAEFNRMNDERKRLAARLDQAEGRGQAMQQVNQDVSKRLAAAMETIRTVLENQAQ